MTKFYLEQRADGAYLMPEGRRATASEENLWKQLDPHEQFKDRLTAPYSRGGAPICSKHEYMLAELRRVATKPQLLALRETFFRLEQVCRATLKDGQALEKGLQRRGEECNNLEDILERFAAETKTVLATALKTTESRREELRCRHAQTEATTSAALVLALEIEAVDREASRIQSALEEANRYIGEGAKA